MGNNFEKKFRLPRPNEIDFPKYEKKNTVDLEIKNVINKAKAESGNYFGNSIYLLKSGNILVGMDYIDEKYCTIRNHLIIYSIPNLKEVKRYTFPNEEDDENNVYRVNNAIQLKNGNILAIRDKHYEFDEESINEGPKRSSENIRYSETSSRIKEFLDPSSIKKKIINKNLIEFIYKVLIEAVDGKVLLSERSGKVILGLDSIKLDENLTTLLKDDWDLDIIFPSEFYPEHLYICKNRRRPNRCSELDVYDIKEFCNEKKKNCLIYNMKISESQNIYGFCEYDKKYLLFDTLNNGIYVFDLETKTKVAVSNMIYKLDSISASYESFGYGKMIKLEDGQLIRWYCHIKIVDIVEGNENDNYTVDSTLNFVKYDKYIILVYPNGYVVVVQLYN